MGTWSKTAPTLPSGESWSAESQTQYNNGSHFRGTYSVASARGLGDTFYIRLTVSVGPGDQDLNANAYYIIEGESTYSVGLVRWSYSEVIYYTGTASASKTFSCAANDASSLGTSTPRASTTVAAPKYWTVSYNGNGATGGSTASQTKARGTALTLRSNGFTRDKYVFVEWNTAADGSGISYAEGASYTADAGATLYAIWKKANIPLFVDVGGTIRQVEKAYANVDGVIRECTVYANVNGTIKVLS